MKTENFKEILYRKEDNGIVTVTLNIPKRKNAMSSYTFFELFWAVDAMEKDDSARIMILTGAQDPDSQDPANESFSSGGYFNPAALEGISEEVKAQIDFTDIAQKKLTLKMFGFDKPVIAAVNGLVIGGAFTMCLSCCDLIYCSEYAWASLPFVGLGIIPELASSYLLPRLIGLQKTKEIMFFAERITAQELFALGLINKVLPHDELMPYARERALKLIPPQGAAYAVRLAKRAIHKPMIEAVTKALDLENQGLNEAFKTGDFLEALMARKEKRIPAFKGA
ncbi:MAG TPA: enoyl-CoA hydratase/isomerase family protein [Thermodesulfobacteriota bacterium]|nr:enoyl-CoA hydratase/isomerase family protein [Thermodesulfobacteriota bacterium]